MQMHLHPEAMFRDYRRYRVETMSNSSRSSLRTLLRSSWNERWTLMSQKGIQEAPIPEDR